MNSQTQNAILTLYLLIEEKHYNIPTQKYYEGIWGKGKHNKGWKQWKEKKTDDQVNVLKEVVVDYFFNLCT